MNRQLVLPIRDPFDPMRHGSLLGTRGAVQSSRCPACGTAYIELKEPLYVTTDIGEQILTYGPGRLICVPCLRLACRGLHLEIHRA